jgi:asparagine synthase (glutamine-hydrolysing)
MCGIAGILTLATSRDHLACMLNGKASVVEYLSRMVRHIGHRGPDDQGMEVIRAGTAHVGLGNTRLAILDLSPAGHQPMRDPTTGNWITYNGEIYNFKELREELNDRCQRSEVRDRRPENGGQKSDVGWQRSETRDQKSEVRGRQSDGGSAWLSNTDTEVILKAYARWGRECVQHLRGMFAFTLWDAARQELFLARDPFGIKPLYYYQTKELFLFSSEIRALLASGLIPRRLSLEGLSSYLYCGSVQEPLTIIEGVRSLLPGHCLVVNTGSTVRLTHVDYACNWIKEEHAPRISNRREAATILRYDLEDSVRLHLVSDVPVGVFLSGGIDSSAIVALIGQVTGEKPKTFSVVFGEKEFSEASYANIVAKQFDTEHHEIPLAEDELLNMLPEALRAMDQPTMDGINTYVVSRAVKEAGITVALSGLGGDELFAGYPSFSRVARLQGIAGIPQLFRKSASFVGRALAKGSVQQRKFWDILESDCSSPAVYTISRQLFAPSEVASLIIDSRSFQSARPPAPCSLLPADLINAMSLCELQGYMANTLLRDTDQMSMAHGLEVRVPFVDTVVVRSVVGLPGAWKTNDPRPKPLLLDAMTGLLPEEIWRRPKMGFTLPFERWMHSVLQAQLHETLDIGKGLELLGIDREKVRAVWQTFQEHPRRERWARPWALYVLKKWCDLNDVRA